MKKPSHPSPRSATQWQLKLPTSTADFVGHSLFIPLALSLLMLSCNKRSDSDQSSRQDGGHSQSSSQTIDIRDAIPAKASPAKASPEPATPIDIEKRKAKHRAAMMKSAMENADKGPEGEEGFNKVLLEWVNDPVLYGERRYARADEEKDEQITYHLPHKATQIQLLKEAAGHFALYKISEQDFKDHMVMVWERYREEYVQQGGKRWIKHSNEDVEKNLMGRHVGQLKYIGPGQEHQKRSPKNKPKIKQVRVPQAIIDAGWESLQNATEYQGPIRTNGGSATYYYDRDTGSAYHSVGYW